MSFKVIPPREYYPAAHHKATISKFLSDEERPPIAKIKDQNGKTKAYIKSRAAKPDGNEWLPGVEIEDGDEIVEMPELLPGLRHCIYCVGQSGTYKSTWARRYANNFIEEFNRLDENPKIIIICVDNPEYDPAFSGLPSVWITPAELVETYTDDPDFMIPEKVNPELRPMLFIMDDLEGITDKVTNKILNAFIEMILTRGRKYRLHSIYISHAGTKTGGKSSVHLLESTHISIPLKHTIGQNIKYTLEKHFNLPPALRKILQNDYINFGTRALISAGGTPQAIFTDKRLIGLDQDKIDSVAEEIKELRKIKAKERKINK